MERGAAGVEWRVMDSANGRAVARFAVAVWPVPDGAPPFPAVAGSGRAGRHFMGIVPGFAGARGTWFGGELRRCLLRRGQKRGDSVGRRRCGKGSKIMAITDRHGLPIAVRVTSASPNECTLVEDTLRHRHVSAVPECMMGDKAYDSDALDQRLQREQGVQLIAPNRRKRRTDGHCDATCGGGKWSDCSPG